MLNHKILWADDEIELLKPHILYLEDKGYAITPVNNGEEAVEQVDEQGFDVVFLDEQMPGMNGLDALSKIKTKHPNLPCVMITKSEEEHIMEDAIGSKIDDYLIKPLKPTQILMSLKKMLENKKLVSQKVNMDYQREFRELMMTLGDELSYEEWAENYKKLVYWELQIENTEERSMMEVLNSQKEEANSNFARFVMDEYESWLHTPESAPLMSHQLMRKRVFPELEKSNRPVFFVLIDNLRLDQWFLLSETINDYFRITRDELYYSILPTTTAYARNAIFSGLMPAQIKKKFPDYWVEDNDDEESKNQYEEEFLQEQLKSARLESKMSYHKVTNTKYAHQLADNISSLADTHDFNVIVYNFVDMLSHARTDSNMIRELAPDESAYRSLTNSWFQHSPLLTMLKTMAQKGAKVIITTDHGTVRVKRPFKIVGDRSVNTNLRYKHGKNLGFDEKDIFVARDPDNFMLPKQNVSTAYVFSIKDYFFAYPNNYNYYVKYYNNTFQHGGVSLEEMIIPYVHLEPK